MYPPYPNAKRYTYGTPKSVGLSGPVSSPRLAGSILLFGPRICANRVKPSRLSRILFGPMFHVQLRPAICAREGATELKRFAGLLPPAGNPAKAGALCRLSPYMYRPAIELLGLNL